MFEDQLTLVLNKIGESFYISLLGANGIVRSNNYYSKNPDILYVKNLIESLPSAFGPYNRVIYMEEHGVMWDYKIEYDIFEKFLIELFASQYHSNLYQFSDFKYHSWKQFSEYVKEYNSLKKESKVYTATNEDMPF